MLAAIGRQVLEKLDEEKRRSRACGMMLAFAQTLPAVLLSKRQLWRPTMLQRAGGGSVRRSVAGRDMGEFVPAACDRVEAGRRSYCTIGRAAAASSRRDSRSRFEAKELLLLLIVLLLLTPSRPASRPSEWSLSAIPITRAMDACVRGGYHP